MDEGYEQTPDYRDMEMEHYHMKVPHSFSSSNAPPVFVTLHLQVSVEMSLFHKGYP